MSKTYHLLRHATRDVASRATAAHVSHHDPTHVTLVGQVDNLPAGMALMHSPGQRDRGPRRPQAPAPAPPSSRP